MSDHDTKIVWLLGRPIDQCGCVTCNAEWRSLMDELEPDTWHLPHFIVCRDCGNKRCPKANWHGYGCTRSNEPGQIGSAYEDVGES